MSETTEEGTTRCHIVLFGIVMPRKELTALVPEKTFSKLIEKYSNWSESKKKRDQLGLTMVDDLTNMRYCLIGECVYVAEDADGLPLIECPPALSLNRQIEIWHRIRDNFLVDAGISESKWETMIPDIYAREPKVLILTHTY